jgi:Xaa-Pro aminopeptidase
MQKLLVLLILSIFSLIASAQDLLPADYLTKEFHAGRREALRALMPENSVAVIFAYPERVFSQDINYVYHPNPDLYYFSGYKEPDAVLFIFKEEQHRGDTAYNELFFVRKRNALMEQWTGRRLGVEGVKEKLGFSEVYNSDEFKNYPIDFSQFSTILHDAFPDDVSQGTLASLMQTFRDKANIKSDENKYILGAYNALVKYTTPSNLATRVNRIKSTMAGVEDEAFRNDPLLLQIIQHPDSATLAEVTQKIQLSPPASFKYNQLVATLREIKTPEEMVVLRKSVFLSAIAHKEVIKAIEPTMSESELTGIYEYVHRKYGAEAEGYPPIVGTGANGCILHYTENNVTQVRNQLVLMDVASEYHGYSADITRTVPANGKFSPEQKQVYQIVYDAQEEVFKLCKEGTPFRQLNEKATEVLANGLLQLGIISDKNDVSRYYMHGCSHHLGLDVHDKSASSVLKENMVITVEPGIYIPEGSPCDPKWWNIAVRIEDDVRVGKHKFENLSVDAPRDIKAIEKISLEKSVINDMKLPEFPVPGKT